MAITEALARVLWIGGAPDAGKTSLARALAGRYGMHAYHYDRFDRLELPGHWARIDAARHPHMHAARARIGDLDARWVHTTPEALLATWQRISAERFPMALDDLRALPPDAIVAEGYGFLPELVAPLLWSPRQAVWLVPTEAFKRARYAEREARGEKGARRSRMSDPARARANHIGRDLLIGQLVLDQARTLGLADNVFVVDGSEPLEATVTRVIAHFQPLLPPPAAEADRAMR
jgi:hypothetical protein